MLEIYNPNYNLPCGLFIAMINLTYSYFYPADAGGFTHDIDNELTIFTTAKITTV